MFSYAIKKKDEIERVAKANRWGTGTENLNDSRKSFVRFFFVLLNMVVGEVFLVGEIYLNLVRG